ncbi:pyrroline-5-carboxylate reductase [Cohnella endophytica]|uniref:Pyrroline-5-carboxylate reductase n=1 Tax=Cohnella endophytica TaxID=2419778 RepID=A0A494Y656_9BACL|nr:pyrroline-5-carboxylate reductase [Cohnella endophytica]RKP57005.1 pyrroline-5-carboxylate reductase [Cohnella endophytica]
MNESSPSSLGGITLCFYGAGSMAEAILRGLIDAKLTNPSNVTVMNRQNAERLLQLQRQYGVIPAATDASKEDALRTSDVIILGMKPKDSANALISLKPLLRPDQLVVSLIAGLTIDTIQQLLGRPQPVVRTMPNTSSTIGLGATGICFSDAVTPEHRELALTMFNAVGLVAVVDEPLIAAVNGVSGSGPAYVYYLMEAMIDAGVKLGLTREAALQLTVQTVKGAAEMVQSTGENPGDLRRKVTSPNGTTEAAILTLDRFSFQEGMNQAIVRCVERANEMGEAIRDEAIKAQQA